MDISCWEPGKVAEGESPLRVDFMGMTDYFPVDGKCINATIGLKAYLRVAARNDDKITVNAGSFGEHTYHLSDISSADDMFIRALALVEYGKRFKFGMDVCVDCEYGAIGLSSSSSVGGLYVQATRLICGLPIDKLEVAKSIQAIEPHWYGRQDQLSVAFGGFNLWHMSKGLVRNGKVVEFGRVDRYPITLSPSKLATLNQCFLIYNSGIEEGAGEILRSVMENYDSDPTLQRIFAAMNEQAGAIYRILSDTDKSDGWLSELGEAFNRIKMLHEQLHPSVTNERMEALFKAAKKAGALGGRYSGAGGRGALTFICRPGERQKITAALNEVETDFHGFRYGRQIHFNGFTEEGAKAWYA